MNKLGIKNFIYLLIFIMFFCLAGPSVINAQTNSSDAIAIRVIPNRDHYSALDWYKMNNFTGSPQSLTVDGYEAVRDGRTVYANVANVDSGKLYTNIYLISYNQEAESVTVDIFGEILKHWKFNTNAVSFGVCVKEAAKSGTIIRCQLDSDCPIKDYCDSNKARIIRDTRRLSDLAGINSSLEAFHIDGHYPKLGAGTYLPQRTISVWPSWQEGLSKKLGAKLPVDPVNELGDCGSPGYNEQTCWNEASKQYIDDFFALPTSALPEMPKNSLAYTYRTDTGGTAKEICAVFESGLSINGETPCGLPICIDRDGDGYGLFDSGNPGVCTFVGADCNDVDPLVHAAAGTEACSNGADDDCDGWVDCADSDCAGSPICSAIVCDGLCNNVCSSPMCSIAKDPDCGCGADALLCCPAGCTSAVDTDCPLVCTADGDNGNCPSGCAYAEDHDCACVDGDSTCGDGCDVSTDDDCAPVCSDVDSDGFYAIDAVWCALGNDCDDTAATGFPIHPGASEVCDGIDNDCNLGSSDGSGESPPLNINQNSICSGSTQSCAGGAWIDDYSGVAGYEAIEASCSDSIDNDCDTLVDGLDPDCSGTCFGVFINESQWYVASEDPDCDQCDYDGDNDGDQPGVWPAGAADLCDSDCGTVSATVQIGNYEAGVETSCDGIDNDCDGTIDESLTKSCYTGPPATQGVGQCQDGTQTCSAGSWGACVGEILPIAEICGNGLDDNCNGLADEGCGLCYRDADGDGFGDPANSIVAAVCPGGYVLNNSDCDDNAATGGYMFPGNPETCDGYDNNCSDPDHAVIDPLQVDEGCDDDGDGFCDAGMTYYNNYPPLVNPCPKTSVADGLPGDDCDDDGVVCSSSGADCYPLNSEICDSYDNNCSDIDHADGVAVADIDEGGVCSAGTCTFTFTFPCTFP